MAKRLKCPNDVRRFLANLLNALSDNKVTESKAGKLAYIANILIKCMEVQHQQTKVESLIARLEELESRIMR